MTKRMLIDATHAEETRVVVLDGNRLTEYDVETSTKKQLKGNIYLAKVVRVEPSLQAAFVEYGGNRHGFLAFSEIHPDYYLIPVADRQRLIELQEQEAAAAEEDDEPEAAISAAVPLQADQPETIDFPYNSTTETTAHVPETLIEAAPAMPDTSVAPEDATALEEPGADCAPEASEPVMYSPVAQDTAGSADIDPAGDTEIPPETLGGEHDTSDDLVRERRSAARFLRNYTIQEVIRRRQILLVQVVKEERGNKGAALTTYISLAGRYSVLMPNSPRGGGVSRKITSAVDRRRLKEIMTDLELPRGMGLIVRTAGANRPRPEIRRDCESLLRLWDDIREHTLRSVAPCLVYEEASLIKRAIRDSYSGDVGDVIVDGEAGWRAARDYMRMMMPTHVRKVQLWRSQDQDGTTQPLFSRFQVEAQLDAMLHPTVQLRSGGYLVINQTEALVAIDVNSGRSTRERGIEETALRTNLEAAEELARQLRLRDLAGLIVIDFIDMESRKHIGMVERRLRDALTVDRARIQLGHISHFGLLEMSRQRLRPSLAETSFMPCPHCAGTGHVRSTESSALHVLRAIEDEGALRRSAEIVVHVAASVALYILNHKRDRLAEIETRYAMRSTFSPDESLLPPLSRIERLRTQVRTDTAPVMMREALIEAEDMAEEEDAMGRAEAEGPMTCHTDRVAGQLATTGEETAEETEEAQRRRRRRRRRRPGGNREEGESLQAGEAQEGEEPSDEPIAPIPTDPAEAEAGTVSEAPRRRSRRGGRRRRREDGSTESDQEPAADSETTDSAPDQTTPPSGYAGPTPADPFGGAFDIFDALEQALDNHAPSIASEPEATPTQSPTIKPVMIGETEPPPKRRGWWRR